MKTGSGGVEWWLLVYNDSDLQCVDPASHLLSDRAAAKMRLHPIARLGAGAAEAFDAETAPARLKPDGVVMELDGESWRQCER